jgi:hypothetical protein
MDLASNHSSELGTTNLQTLQRLTGHRPFTPAQRTGCVGGTSQNWRPPCRGVTSRSNKQKRQTDHIEEGYENHGIPEKEAERRAWATVNKQDHGGKKSGSGVGRAKDTSSSRKGGRPGDRASTSRPSAERSKSAKKAAATRRARGS